MQCRNCKKKIKEDEGYQQVALSFVHKNCLDEYVGTHLDKAIKKKKKYWDKANADKKKTSYKKTLWTDYFSPYIRQREADDEGNTKCISCGKTGHWTTMDAGHFIPKSAGEYFYFNESNVWQQCKKCNLYGSQDTGANYQKNLRKKIGDKKVDVLLDAKNKRPTHKSTLDGYKAMAKKYKELL